MHCIILVHFILFFYLFIFFYALRLVHSYDSWGFHFNIIYLHPGSSRPCCWSWMFKLMWLDPKMQYRLIWNMSFGGIRRDLLFLSGDHLLSGPCTFRFSIYFIFLFSIILFIYTCRRYCSCCSVWKQKLSRPCACINES